MAFLVGGANSAVSGYDIENSLRLNSGDSPNLSWTPSSSGNQRTCTFSCWVKRSLLGSHLQPIWSTKVSTAGTNAVVFMPGNGANDKMHLVVAGTDDSNFGQTTSNTFRDVSAWYHLVARIDTTQGTAANRIRAYVNGESVTLSGTPGYPDEDETCRLSDNDRPQTIGEDERDNIHFDGYVSEVAFIDGASLAPTSFAETDEDSGIWKPKDFKDDVTFGTNGYYLEFKETGTSQNSSGIGADTSGNDNHFAVTNLAATDITTDTPTNNFATLNAVDTHTTSSPTLSEGNLDLHGIAGTPFTPARSTIAVSQGKWYMEYKFIDAGGGVGVMTTQSPINDHLRDDADVRSVYRNSSAGYYYGRNNAGAVDDAGGNSTTLSANDIGMIALDLDNGYVYFGKNGTYMNGIDGSTEGNPAGNNGGSGGAGNLASQLLTNQHDGQWAFMAYDISTATTGQVQCNFGNAPYSISSGNADANGYGNFEYAVPSGFYSLCTKNLAEYG